MEDDVLLINYVLPLPAALEGDNWKYLKPLVGAISRLPYADANKWQRILPMIKSSKIAADGNHTLRTPSELYDHEAKLFQSAFRNQKETRFLEDSCGGLRDHRLFWLKVGLRRVDNSINAEDYLLCLQVMRDRLSANGLSGDQRLDQDIRVVLEPLITPSSSTRNFQTNHWNAISQERVFRSRTQFNPEPEYRRSTMNSVATGKPMLALSEIISGEYIAICWSQTPFPLHQPTREVLRMIPGNGEPNVDMVWRHLQHMKSIAQNLRRDQISNFLADLSRVYDCLQDHQSTSTFSDSQDSALWLNVDSLDPNTVVMAELNSSWCRIEELVLSSSCDSGDVKAVKPGLMRYEKLLRAAGCASIIYPTITPPVIHSGKDLAGGLREMWKKEQQVDIAFSTQGKLIKAHRLVLSALSDKFAAQFSGRWTIEDVIKYDEAEDPDGFLPHHTLLTMLRYAYQEPIDWVEMQVKGSDNADDKAAKLDLENVIDVRELAARSEGKSVEDFCAKFIEQNRAAVQKAHGGSLK